MMTYYSNNANDLVRFYQSVDPEHLHQSWSDLLPDQPGLACDVGAGSGRDAAWLASKGWDVIAVEPVDELRKLGEQHTSSQTTQLGSVTWLDDQLPELKHLRELDQRFQLILVSAVWMHLKPTEHERAMRIISELLAPDGLLVISLRHGPDDAGRFHSFQTDKIIEVAKTCAMECLRDIRGVPDTSRSLVSWDYLVFNAQKPQSKQTPP
jgi:SAM-dependent methyltransferase